MTFMLLAVCIMAPAAQTSSEHQTHIGSVPLLLQKVSCSLRWIVRKLSHIKDT